MTVNIHIRASHRRHTDGRKTVKVKGNTIGKALGNLVLLYPGMEFEMFDKKGEILGYVEIYLNNETAYPNELEKKVKPGDDIQIITFLAGG